jgi:hypothetical protein
MFVEYLTFGDGREIAMLLPAEKRCHASIPRAGFEASIPVFELSQTQYNDG